MSQFTFNYDENWDEESPSLVLRVTCVVSMKTYTQASSLNLKLAHEETLKKRSGVSAWSSHRCTRPHRHRGGFVKKGNDSTSRVEQLVGASLFCVDGVIITPTIALIVIEKLKEEEEIAEKMELEIKLSEGTEMQRHVDDEVNQPMTSSKLPLTLSELSRIQP
ncbi:unnamed protein product [Clavelina lepadiformis]|uniref:Uncharacterized protein n=1 Tax=Clavelina lepadiformis TaxID=159417 RepID=A0ABP0GJ67_CLALP